MTLEVQRKTWSQVSGTGCIRGKTVVLLPSYFGMNERGVRKLPDPPGTSPTSSFTSSHMMEQAGHCQNPWSRWVVPKHRKTEKPTHVLPLGLGEKDTEVAAILL